MIQSQHCNNDNNYNVDNVMHASVWFAFFGGYLLSKPMIYGKETCEQGARFKLRTSLGFQDIREGVTLRRLILRSLECTLHSHLSY